MDTEEKRKYEIALFTKDELSASAVADLLAAEEADIVIPPKPSLTKLAYPIQKEESAFFSFIDFDMVPAKAAVVDKKLKLNRSVLRFLIVTPPPAKAVAKSFGRKPISENTGEILAKAMNEAPKESLSNEALEQKLEEILS